MSVSQERYSTENRQEKKTKGLCWDILMKWLQGIFTIHFQKKKP